jgi:hypothetical protein
MIGRTVVMNVQIKSSERMGFLTVERTYIQRRKKIKNKLTILKQNRINQEIVARRRLSQQENCVERRLRRGLQQLVRRGPIALHDDPTGRTTSSIGRSLI